MDKLDHLYEGKENLERAGYEIPENILHDLDELETELIKDEVIPAISKDIEPRLSKIRRDVVLVVEYHPGEPVSVAMTRKVKISEISGAITLTPKNGTPITSDEKIEETPEHEPTRHVENFTKGLRVTFPDGTVICQNTAIDTMIAVLRKIGLERIPQVGITRNGYNLVGKVKRPTVPGRIWQHECDGWYIYSNMSNDTKAADLQMVSDYYNLSLKIENGKPDTPAQELNLPRRKRGRKPKQTNFGDNTALIERFQRYVELHNNPQTAKSYTTILNTWVRVWINRVVDENADSVFGYTNIADLKTCIDLLMENKDFVDENDRKHHPYSAALKKYLNFRMAENNN